MSVEKIKPEDLPKTNADRIREMTDEELCEFIMHIEHEARTNPLIHGSKSTMRWLKERAE